MITVIIPCYNASETILETLKSVLNQSFTELFIHIYDDCSTDDTVEKIKSIRDFRIKIFKGNKNKGVNYARDFLISTCKTKYISFLDSDDYYHIDKLKIQKEFLDNNENIALVGTKIQLVDEENRSIKYPELTLTSDNMERMKSRLFFENSISTSSVMVRTKVIKAYRFSDFKYSFGEDYYLWLEIIKKHEIINLDKKLTYYRISNSGLTRTLESIKGDALKHIHYKNFCYNKIPLKFLDCHVNHLIHKNINPTQLKESISFYKYLLSIDLIDKKEIILNLSRKLSVTAISKSKRIYFLIMYSYQLKLSVSYDSMAIFLISLLKKPSSKFNNQI